mgnify:CR=1 FL=1
MEVIVCWASRRPGPEQEAGETKGHTSPMDRGRALEEKGQGKSDAKRIQAPTPSTNSLAASSRCTSAWGTLALD